MKGYLLDTNICIFLLRHKYDVDKRLAELSPTQCYISEITVAELKYGAYKSNRTEENLALIDELVDSINVVPFAESIDIYAQEKNRLRTQGIPIEDFDLLIASAAIYNGITLVTDNTKHFTRIERLMIENWVER